MTRIALLSLALASLGGCQPQHQIEPPTPRLAVSLNGDYGPDGPYDDVLSGPGGPIYVTASWQGACQHDNLFDGPSNSACDDQTFRVRIACGGVECTANQRDALTADGVKLSGAGYVTVRPKAAGELTITVSMEHVDSHETITTTDVRSIVEPDRVAIDCRYEIPVGTPYVECPPDGTPYAAGSSFIFWYGAYQGEKRVLVDQTQELRGWQDIEPSYPIERENIVQPQGPGTYGVHTNHLGLRADYSITLR